MFEYTCEYCGKVRQARDRSRVRRFCSLACSAESRKKPKKELVKRRYREELGECVFQPTSVLCADRKCGSCGWNPVVAKARLEAITGKKVNEE